MAVLPVVLFLRPASESLHALRYLETVAGRPYLSWLVERFTGFWQVEPDQLYIACQSDRQRDAILVAGGKAKILKSRFASRLKAYAAIASDLGAPCLAFLSIEAGFAPASLLGRMASHHINCGNNYTGVTGFPSGCSPEIYDRDLLSALSSLRVPGLPSEPSVAIQRLAAVSAAAGTAPPCVLRAKPFYAAASYGVQPWELPREILISDVRDMELARRVIQELESGAGAGDQLAALRLWKAAVRQARFTPPRVRASLTPRRRVLYVSNSSAFAGGAQSLCQVAAAIDPSRFQRLALISLRGTFTEKLAQAGVEVFCPGHDFAAATVENFEYVQALLRKLRPDIVHFNGLAGTPILFASSALEIPIVQHLRLAQIGDYLSQLRAASAVIAVSEFVKEQALRLDVPPERLFVIHNGIDPAEFDPAKMEKGALRRSLGIPADRKLALMIARFEPQKRYDLFFQAAAMVKTRLPSLELALVGESHRFPEYQDAVLEMIERLKLAGCTRVYRFFEDVRQIEAAADVLVSCSDNEALARCVIEAMALEVPVIITDSGGTREIVEDGKTGLLVPPGDADALAGRMIELLTVPELGARLGSAAREHVVSHLTAKIAAQRTMEVYENLVFDTRRKVR